MNSPSEQMQFIKVTNGSEAFGHVRHYFQSQISSLYGNQEKALKKISDAKDRTCELLQTLDSQDLGIVVYKNQTTHEFKELSYDHAFEIKTLFVIDPLRNSGKRVATKLLHHIAQTAYRLKASSVFVTVSSQKPESLAFFLSNGFLIGKIEKNLYIPGLDEYFLFHPSPKKLLGSTSLELLLPEKQRSHLNITKAYLEECDFNRIEEKLLEAYINNEQPIKVVNNYFGINISNKFTDKVVQKLIRLALKWQEPNPNQHYTIVFLNPLYRDKKKLESIGDLLIGITPHGKRHVLACCPPGHLPKSYWDQIFKAFKIRGIETVDIFCTSSDYDLSESIRLSYKNTKTEVTTNYKSWLCSNLFPMSTGYELLDDLVKLSSIVSPTPTKELASANL